MRSNYIKGEMLAKSLVFCIKNASLILPAHESLVSQQHPLKHQKLSPVTEMHCVTSFV